MKLISASDLRERISIQTVTKTNTKGVLVESWSDSLTNVPARVEFESDYERIRAGREEATQSIKVFVRSEISIDQKARIIWDSATWQVIGFPRTVDKRRRFQRFVATKTDS